MDVGLFRKVRINDKVKCIGKLQLIYLWKMLVLMFFCGVVCRQHAIIL